MLECHKLQFYSTAHVSGKVVTTTTKSNATGLKEVKTMYCRILQHLRNTMHTNTFRVLPHVSHCTQRMRAHTAFPSCRASTTTSRSVGVQCAWAVSKKRLNTLSDAHACGTTARTHWLRSDASKISFLRYHRVCPTLDAHRVVSCVPTPAHAVSRMVLSESDRTNLPRLYACIYKHRPRTRTARIGRRCEKPSGDTRTSIKHTTCSSPRLSASTALVPMARTRAPFTAVPLLQSDDLRLINLA